MAAMLEVRMPFWKSHAAYGGRFPSRPWPEFPECCHSSESLIAHWPGVAIASARLAGCLLTTKIMGLITAPQAHFTNCPKPMNTMPATSLKHGLEAPGQDQTRVLVNGLFIALPVLVVLFQQKFEPWVFMWMLAIAVFIGCKRFTWTLPPASTTPIWIRVAYLFFWPGLNAKEFFGGTSRLARPTANRWLAAIGKTLFGAVLFWGIARLLVDTSILLAGWIGLFGLIFLLHFGTFHLLALFWQLLGLNAQPLMRAPVLATSLEEFWGKRWNSAFSHVANETILRKLFRRFGVNMTMLLVFLVSGLVHELVISLPARGGLGLPTFYFLVQGSAMAFERSKVGRDLGLGCGGRGWFFTMLVTAAPAFWLFHPPFVLRVIVPFMHALRAL
jgi:Membrane bound O-acyl transferase family